MLNKELTEAYDASRTATATDRLCHAPFVSMNFDIYGCATACCFNRSHKLGTYPQQSITQMWHGRNAKLLRESISANDLSLGCNICESQLSARDFGSVHARMFDEFATDPQAQAPRGLLGRLKKRPRIPMPRVMEFEISNRCNLACIMCGGEWSSTFRRDREALPPIPMPYDHAFVDQLTDFIPHLQRARFLGGEPFLIDLYYDIWDLIQRVAPSLSTSITTNGTVLTPRGKAVLESLNVDLIVSIDSLQKPVYESIRVGADFDLVMENVRYFIENTRRRNRSLSFSICPMQQNWRELPHLVEYCNTHRIQAFFNSVFRPAHATLSLLPADELLEVAAYLQTFSFPQRDWLEEQNSQHYASMTQQIAGWAERVHGRVARTADLFTRVTRTYNEDPAYGAAAATPGTRQTVTEMLKYLATSEFKDAHTAPHVPAPWLARLSSDSDIDDFIDTYWEGMATALQVFNEHVAMPSLELVLSRGPLVTSHVKASPHKKQLMERAIKTDLRTMARALSEGTEEELLRRITHV